MLKLVDNYSESNFSFSLDFLSSVDAQKVGMNFRNTFSGPLDSCKFYLSKNGSPTGNAVAKLYSITGTYGVNSIPTGAALATSDNFDVSLLSSGSYQLITFNFTGANRYSMVANTNYVVSIEYSGGGTGIYVKVGGGNSDLPTGNPVQDYGSGWETYTGDGYCFYVYSFTTGLNSATPSHYYVSQGYQ